MIIRPACESKFTSLPNVIFTDNRLNADTRAMLALLLSKPKNWQVRPRALAKELSRAGDKPVGKKRLGRMFREAMNAGYLARSAEQGRQRDGDWGTYIYFVGLEADVAKAVKESGVAILAQVPGASAPHASAPEGPTHSYKRKNLQTTESKKTPPTSPPERTETSQVAEDELPFDAERAKSGSMNGHSLNRSANCAIEGAETIQHRIAQLLGDGDVARGWLLLGQLSDTDRDQLTAQARANKLSDLTVTTMRMKAGGAGGEQ